MGMQKRSLIELMYVKFVQTHATTGVCRIWPTCDAETIMLSRKLKLGTIVVKATRQEGQVLKVVREIQLQHSVCPHDRDIGRRSVS